MTAPSPPLLPATGCMATILRSWAANFAWPAGRPQLARSAGHSQFQPNETDSVSTTTANVNGWHPAASGNAYASFLLGQIDTATSTAFRIRSSPQAAWGLFIQDTWKVTRQAHSRLRPALGPTGLGTRDPLPDVSSAPPCPTPMPATSRRHPLFEGYGPGRCNCLFTKTYIRDRSAPGRGLSARFKDRDPRRAQESAMADSVICIHHQRGSPGRRFQRCQLQ